MTKPELEDLFSIMRLLIDESNGLVRHETASRAIAAYIEEYAEEGENQ